MIELARHYLMKADDHWAGFVWVIKGSLFAETERPHPRDHHFSIDEFFHRAQIRGRGLGGALATHTFDLYAGTWEVTEIRKTTPAQNFWRRVIEIVIRMEILRKWFSRSRMWGKQPCRFSRTMIGQREMRGDRIAKSNK